MPSLFQRLHRLRQALEFLDVPSKPGVPHLVTASRPHCMYGFTDMEPKEGHVLFTSLLVIQAGVELATAVESAAAAGVPGCTAVPSTSKLFRGLAAAVNDSIAAGYLDDHRGAAESRLLLATDVAGHNSQPDVWGSGLAFAIDAGTHAQRKSIARALADGAGGIFRWGQARHLPLPLCWEVAGLQHGAAANPNQCTETGKGGWCGSEPCGSYQVRPLQPPPQNKQTHLSP